MNVRIYGRHKQLASKITKYLFIAKKYIACFPNPFSPYVNKGFQILTALS